MPVPEGDTVFLAARRLEQALGGSPLVRGELRHPRVATADLAGRTVLDVESVGKHLFLRFDDRTSLHCHFRMDGLWRLYAPGERWHGRPHEIRAVLANEHRVAVGIRLHELAVLATEREYTLVGHLGPDPLSRNWNAESAAEAKRRLLRDPRRELGLALLDQTVMAGIGNVYRAEVCFLLGRSPWTPVSEVDAARVVELCRTLLSRNAWRPRRSTTGSLAGNAAYWVYSRTGYSCRRCGTPIRSGVQGGTLEERTTWFCPVCQPGPHP